MEKNIVRLRDDSAQVVTHVEPRRAKKNGQRLDGGIQRLQPMWVDNRMICARLSDGFRMISSP